MHSFKRAGTLAFISAAMLLITCPTLIYAGTQTNLVTKTAQEFNPSAVHRVASKHLSQFGNEKVIYSDGSVRLIAPTGNQLRSYRQGYEYYGADGYQYNFLSPTEEYEEKSQALLRGTDISFTSIEDLCHWMEYFSYYRNDFNDKDIVAKSSTSDLFTVKAGRDYSRSSVLVDKLVEELADRVTGDTISDRVQSAVKLASQAFDYNYQYREGEPFGLHYAIQSRKAICVQYTALVYRVLERLGIQAEICKGEVDYQQTRGNHCWLRVNLNQNNKSSAPAWVYVDPTFYDLSQDTGFLNIDPDTYISCYSMDGVLRER